MIRKANVLIFGMVLLLSSCVKSKERDLQTSKDYALVQNNLSMVVPLVVHSVQSKSYVLDKINSEEDTLNSCAEYHYVSGDTVDITNENVVFEILFSQCYDKDLAKKNGSLMVNIDKYFNTDSAICNLTFDAFSINDNIMQGDIRIKRINGGLFEVSSSNLTVIVGTRSIKYEGTFEMTMGTGQQTDLLYDNTFTLQDEGTILNRFGVLNNFIGTDIRRQMTCNYISSGLVVLDDNSENTQILDFGDSTCNNIATVTSAENEVSFGM